MQQDLRLMLCQKLFRITACLVRIKNLFRFCKVDDMPPQNGDLRHARLCRFDLRRQRMELFRRCLCFLLQIGVIHQIVFFQICHRLTELLRVKLGCPALVAAALSGTDFSVNINQ